MSKNSVVDVKVYLATSDIRRFCASSYEDLCLKLQRICSVDVPSMVADSAASEEKKNEVKVQYIDDESEWVSLSSENEWVEAILHHEGESALKIRVSSDGRGCGFPPCVAKPWKCGRRGFGRRRGGRGHRGRRGRRGGRRGRGRRFQVVPHGDGFRTRLSQRIRCLRQRCRRLRMRLNKGSRGNHPRKAKNLRTRLQRLRCRLLMMTALHQRRSGCGGGFSLTQQWKEFAPDEVENPRKIKKEFGARCERRGRKNRHCQFRENRFGSQKHREGRKQGGLGVHLPMRMKRVRERIRRLHLRIQRTEDAKEKKMLRRRLQRLKSRFVMMKFLRRRQSQKQRGRMGFRGGRGRFRGRGGRGRMFGFRFDGFEDPDVVGKRMEFPGKGHGWSGQRFQKWRGNRFGRVQSMRRFRRRGGNEWRRGFEEI